MKSYDICLSLSDLLHLVWSSLGPSMLLRMLLFYSFLWLSSIPLYAFQMYHIFIHSSISGHLSGFPALATVNSAAMNIGVHVSFWVKSFICIYSQEWNCWCVQACSVNSVVSDSCAPRTVAPPGFSVHGIPKAGMLEWVAMPSSRGSSRPRN